MSALSDRDFRTSSFGPDLEPHILRPTPAELETRVLYSTWRDHPMLPLEDNYKIESLERLGLKLTVVREPEEVIAAKDFDFLFISVFEGAFPGHETLAPGLCALRGIPCLGASGTVKA